MARQPSSSPVVIPSRSGTSQIGTSSPNSGAKANTNSTYAQGAFTSGITTPGTASYSVQNTDYQGVIIFNTSSAIAVTLNSAVATNFTCTVLNLGSGAITLTPTLGALVNGSSSLTLSSMQGVQVFFANGAWIAYAGSTVIPTVPSSIGPTAHEWVNSYTAGTGVFTLSQPAFTDISGNLATSQLPTAGLSVTITTAQLTPTGTQGSMTFTNGILTAQTPAT